MIIDLQERRDNRRKEKEMATCQEIQEDMNGLWATIESISHLPYPLQVRLVSYCLQHFITFEDLTKKFE